jgi:hypothetical protein
MKLAISMPGFLVLTLWVVGTVLVDGPESQLWSGVLSLLFVVVVIALIVLVRPIWKLWVSFLVLFALVQIWWLGIVPSNDRQWLVDVAELPSVTFDGDFVTLSNVRNFHYRSENDFDEIWETRTYDLSQVRGFDLFLSYWGSPMIAHTIASWEFADGQHLAISIETRKEVGEEYSAVLGFFRQYELYYVVADERDVIGVRTNHRGEDVYLYRMKTPVPVARALLVSYLEEMNRLVNAPRWYNALVNNCTTVIRQHAQHVAARRPFDWRIIVNGYIDELGYERGTIDTSLPFDELRRRSNITERGKAAGTSPDFSQQIREGLPTADRPPLIY